MEQIGPQLDLLRLNQITAELASYTSGAEVDINELSLKLGIDRKELTKTLERYAKRGVIRGEVRKNRMSSKPPIFIFYGLENTRSTSVSFKSTTPLVNQFRNDIERILEGIEIGTVVEIAEIAQKLEVPPKSAKDALKQLQKEGRFKGEFLKNPDRYKLNLKFKDFQTDFSLQLVSEAAENLWSLIVEHSNRGVISRSELTSRYREEFSNSITSPVFLKQVIDYLIKSGRVEDVRDDGISAVAIAHNPEAAKLILKTLKTFGRIKMSEMEENYEPDIFQEVIARFESLGVIKVDEIGKEYWLSLTK